MPLSKKNYRAMIMDFLYNVDNYHNISFIDPKFPKLRSFDIPQVSHFHFLNP
jgi:hypothetical protein